MTDMCFSCPYTVVPTFPLDTMTCPSKPIKPNGKLESSEATGSPPRTTLLGTIFSPVFNFFSPATKTGNKNNK